MGDGRSYQGDVPMTPKSSPNRNPPPGFLKLTVLELFKRKLTERKKSVSYHENVVHWDDSAGEEALLNARKRFWLQINDLPYDMFLPDPDIYIDEVDWNSEIDPQLLLDLDKITSGS